MTNREGKTMKTKIVILTMILVFASLYAADVLYSAMNDRSDRLSNDQAGVFSPGYINAAKQKTENIINQSSKPKSLMENIAEYVKNKLGDKVNEDAADKPTPELKKKRSATNENKPATIAAEADTILPIDIADEASLYYNVLIGSGSQQNRDANGRLISEVFNGKLHVYAGFDNVGIVGPSDSTNSVTPRSVTNSVIMETIWYAYDKIKTSNNGAIVLIKGGAYNLLSVPGTYGRPLQLSNGVSLYGGYREDGTRDVKNSPTIINSGEGGVRISNITKPTEFNGFTINGTETLTLETELVTGRYLFNEAGTLNFRNQTKTTNLIIRNNTFNAGFSTYYGSRRYGGYGITTWLSANVLIENNKFNCANVGLSVYFSENIVSRNNIFNSPYGIQFYNGSRSTGSSASDYFSNSQVLMLDKTSTISINDSRKIDTYKGNNNVITPNRWNNANTHNKMSTSNLTSTIYLGNNESINTEALSSIFKGLLKNKNDLLSKETGLINPAILEKIAMDTLNQSALSAPIVNLSAAKITKMELAMKLSSIIANPTEDQKMILDSVMAILNETDKEGEGSVSPELKKAQDDLLQMVASVLIAQAIPDLLKEGDVLGIKNIFSELNASKNRIMSGYQESTKPYYDEMVKELEKNMSVLQLKNILSNSMSSKDLEKMPRNDIDKVLEKLRQAKDKSFEAEYILQEEAKYRKAYLDPNKKIMEERMKAMMRDFTSRLSKVLESAGGAKK